MIKQLDSETINKIAAGEVIHRPSNALKEMLENSIDASSTSISISIREGGLAMMRIKDNGKGIYPQDFELLCKRFATSKISSYEDLTDLHTFGFRGEALSSISQVSKVTVSSKRCELGMGYKASFNLGSLVAAPEACSIDKGTIITVDDLFYNLQTRLKSFRTQAEALKCHDVVGKYAIHFNEANIQFMNGAGLDFNTANLRSKIEIIQQVFRYTKAKDQLVDLPSTTLEGITYSGIVSNSQFNMRKKKLILFINNRLVKSSELTKQIQGVYSTYSPTTNNFFVYLSLKVPANLIDVNIHPTKREVKFIYSERVFIDIVSNIEHTFQNTLTFKTYQIKTLAPSNISSIGNSNYQAPKSQVRETSDNTRLEWFTADRIVPVERKPEENLSSIQELKEEIEVSELQRVMDDFVYVGAVNKDNILVQHKTQLYLMLAPMLLQQLIYQYILEKFSTFSVFQIPNSDLDIRELLDTALRCEFSGYNPIAHPPRDELISRYSTQILERQELLTEYFSISFQDFNLITLPVILDGLVQPDINNLSEFLLRLACDINWGEEKACLDGISRLVAWFYSRVPDEWSMEGPPRGYTEHYKNSIFPYLKGRLLCDAREISEGKDFIKLVSTESLYRIFERC
jgi:DNA mismatch repair protein MLH1